MEHSKIEVIKYSSSKFVEEFPTEIETAFKAINNSSVTWININEKHKAKIVEKIGQKFNVHPLVLEKIITSGQRPKVEVYDDYIYTVLRALYYSEKKELTKEQISIIVGKNYVITFQQSDVDVFKNIKELIREKGNIIKSGTDYLLYAILDSIVDNYFDVANNISEKSEKIENLLLKQNEQKVMEKIFDVKKHLSLLREAAWPVRDAINKLEKTESKLIGKTTKFYLQDIGDHTIQIIDSVEVLRDRNSSMADIHLSNQSNRMNEVMKVLTIIATIFIPLTFITGLYGMNFKYMPEIQWLWGYPSSILLMIIVAIAMLIYFKKKKWL